MGLHSLPLPDDCNHICRVPCGRFLSLDYAMTEDYGVMVHAETSTLSGHGSGQAAPEPSQVFLFSKYICNKRVPVSAFYDLICHLCYVTIRIIYH